MPPAVIGSAPGLPWWPAERAAEHTGGREPLTRARIGEAALALIDREGLDALTAEVQADGDLSAEERTSLLGRISVYQSDMQRAAVGDATEEAVRSLRG